MGAERFRVIARAIIMTPDRRVVLVTSRSGQALVLPGGAVDAGETLPEAAAREAIEECGVEATIGQAIWLREFVDRGRRNLEVYFLARLASAPADRWTHHDADKPDLARRAGLYSRDDLRSAERPVYPEELRDAFWEELARGLHEVYLGSVASGATDGSGETNAA